MERTRKLLNTKPVKLIVQPFDQVSLKHMRRTAMALLEKTKTPSLNIDPDVAYLAQMVAAMIQPHGR